MHRQTIRTFFFFCRMLSIKAASLKTITHFRAMKSWVRISMHSLYLNRENVSKIKNIWKILQFHLWKESRTFTLLKKLQNLLFRLCLREESKSKYWLINELKIKMFSIKKYFTSKGFHSLNLLFLLSQNGIGAL